MLSILERIAVLALPDSAPDTAYGVIASVAVTSSSIAPALVATALADAALIDALYRPGRQPAPAPSRPGRESPPPTSAP